MADYNCYFCGNKVRRVGTELWYCDDCQKFLEEEKLKNKRVERRIFQE